jgi:hypothetical protein
LKPLNYDWNSEIVLAVDTSYKGVGAQVYQLDPVDPKIKYYAKYLSIGLNERESRFSQPKRELFGLKRALEALQYWGFSFKSTVMRHGPLCQCVSS